ncbi:MAG: hypothetical protein AB7F86_12705 [Bdellovibrionales bacterium]
MITILLIIPAETAGRDSSVAGVAGFFLAEDARPFTGAAGAAGFAAGGFVTEGEASGRDCASLQNEDKAKTSASGKKDRFN